MKDIDLTDFQVLTHPSVIVIGLWSEDAPDLIANIKLCREACAKLSTLYNESRDLLSISKTGDDGTKSLTGSLIFYRDAWKLWQDAGNSFRQKILSTQEDVGARIDEIFKEIAEVNPEDAGKNVEVSYFLVRRIPASTSCGNERVSTARRGSEGGYGPSLGFYGNGRAAYWKRVGTALKNAKGFAKARYGEIEVWAKVDYDAGRFIRIDSDAVEAGTADIRKVAENGHAHWELRGARFVTAINHIREI